MLWAILWAAIFGYGAGGVNSFNGWAAAFGFALSLGWVLHNEMERKAVELYNKNISLQKEIDMLQSKHTKLLRPEADYRDFL